MTEQIPAFKNTYEILVYAAKQWPEHPSVVDEFGTLDCASLHREAEKLREALKQAGLKKGQGLGVMARNGRGMILGLFAGMGCGATVLPISHQLKKAEIDIIVSEAGLHAVIDDGSGVEPVSGESAPLHLGSITFRLAWTGKDRETPMVPLDDAAFVRFTSGTTGQSKGVVLTHRSLLERIDAAQKALGLTHDDVVLWVLPMAYHFLVTIVMYIRYGITIAVCKDIFAESMMTCANENRATFFYAAPMHFRLLASDKSGRRFETVNRVISTSSAIPVAIAKAFQERHGLEVNQAYGIIEAGLPLVKTQTGDESLLEAVGRVTPGFEVGILDDQLRELPRGETGKLAIRGPGMFDAYLEPFQTRDEVFQNGWFLTGDLATESEDGVVRVVGREKAMINVSGNKVFPEEVEFILNQHKAVKASRIFGANHPLMGEIVCADIVKAGDEAIDTEEIIAYCRKNLSTYKVPQRVKFVDDIPLTGSGKVIRS